MKNKKGFTLVELLAVIAILALLVILVLPNIMGLFNEAKKNLFTNEVKTIYKTANQQYISESMFDSNEKIYSKCSDNCNNPLKLSGRDNLQYYVKLNRLGKVVEYLVTDGTYQYYYNGTGLNIEDIYNVYQISELDDDDIITVTSSGIYKKIHIATFVTRQVAGEISPTDELTIEGESFYVLSSNSSETLLFAKYDLNKNTNLQAINSNYNSMTKISFQSNGYWDGCKHTNSTDGCTSSPNGLLSPYSDGGKGYCGNQTATNCAYVYDNNSNAYSVVNAYTNKLSTLTGVNITGRLLMLEEANTLYNLGTKGKKVLKDPNGEDYYLGTARSNNVIWRVYSSGTIGCTHYFWISSAVRPVLIVDTNVL